MSSILTFSRQSEQERKPVQVASVIEEVFKLLRSTFPMIVDEITHDTQVDKSLRVESELILFVDDEKVLVELGQKADPGYSQGASG